jgi:SAM-dependent methyltransferase
MIGGGDFVCNFCGYASDRFLPDGTDVPVLNEKKVIGGGLRPNSTCPQCASTDRERLVKVGIEKNVALPPSPRILHVAPERRLNRFLRSIPGASVVECDLDPARYEWTTRIQSENVTELSFPEATFDLVVCNHVLEHVPDDAKALGELRRVIKPGGLAVLQVPYSDVLTKTDEDPSIDNPSEQLHRFGQEDHVRIYSRSDFIGRAERAGFESLFLSPSMFVGYSRNAVSPNEGLLIFRRPCNEPPPGERL